jgi:hypothetical protein
MPFLYLRDPLFLACMVTYFVHRWLNSEDLTTSWSRAYLNDLICLPFWVPIMLSLQRTLRLRSHDEPPQAAEIVLPLVLWAVVFEVVLPATRTWSGLAFPDPLDVLCYAAGGLASAIFWRWWYQPPLLHRFVAVAHADADAQRLAVSQQADADFLVDGCQADEVDQVVVVFDARAVEFQDYIADDDLRHFGR